MRRLILILLLILLLPVAVNAQQQTYTVQPGDTLRAVAQRFNVDLQTLAAANNIQNINRILVGQVLTIPTGNITGQTYTVQRGDTLREIANRYNVTLESLVAVNNITTSTTIFPGDVLNLPAIGGPTSGGQAAPTTPVVTRPVVSGVYIVQAGDTLSQIARAFGVDMYNIARANGILNLNRIYTGQALRIP